MAGKYGKGRFALAVEALARVDVHQGHGTAPHATGVEGEHAGFITPLLQRGPVAKDDLCVSGLAFLVGEPGFVAGQGGVGAFLAFEVRICASAVQKPAIRAW